MTRREARMVAEELFILMQKEKAEDKRTIGAKEAAQMLGWSLRTLYNRVNDIPHEGGTKGKRLRFKVSAIQEFNEQRY